ncbi:MAG: hypothetical protein R3F61_04155 [Myxococcota bacterium]
MRRTLAILALAATPVSCKVPIHGVEAAFTLADASWFDEEDTLFVFYEVSAEQGIEDPSVIEISFATDTERVDWTPLADFEMVHTHLPVDCGATSLCGSASIHVPLEPREVKLRLRYHRDGELALTADEVFNVVGLGPAHSNRSLIVYGVFDGENQRVQWRGRHRFPTVRNEQASRLGLRRRFTVENARFGDLGLGSGPNPYSYGVPCPEAFVSAGLPSITTEDRAVFHVDSVPLAASDSPTVCGDATVTDALGTFTTGATARKNPEVRPAFPVLRSPVHEATQLKFFLAPCDRVIDEDHAAMQRQRLFMEDTPTTCIDDWRSPGFVDSLVVELRDAVEAARPAGNDMVLVIALHQDETGVSATVEDALVQVVPGERHRASPRLAGAFVFDSTTRGLTAPELAPSTLWCPSTLIGDDASTRTCPALPDLPDLDLGPFSFGVLPILPPRQQYLRFIEDYGPGQTGEATAVTYLTPEFATTSDHVDLGSFGVVTFLNGETIAAEPDDAFSYCVQEEPQFLVVRSPAMQNPQIQQQVAAGCALGLLAPALCTVPDAGLMAIEGLPDWHAVLPEEQYEVGLFWEFPFLFRMEYRAVVAGAVSAFGLSVPFGLGTPAEAYYGTPQWLADSFTADPELLQCTRYCDHPTFDSAGVYHVADPFRSTYAHACYVPDLPMLGDSGFPRDP